MQQALGYVALGLIGLAWCGAFIGAGIAHWRAYLAAQAHRQGH